MNISFRILLILAVTEVKEVTVTDVLAPTPIVEVPDEKEGVEITFAPIPETDDVTFERKPSDEAPLRPTTDVVSKPEEVPEFEKIEIVTKPDDEPKPETVEVTTLKDEVTAPTTVEVSIAPTPDEMFKDEVDIPSKPEEPGIVEYKPPALWEAPQDFEIVIERLDEKAPEDVTTDVTTKDVVPEEGIC